MKALHIKTDLTIEVLDLKDEDEQLAQLQSLVGGYIEMVNLTDSLTMWLNEEGKLDRLPVSSLGTALFHQYVGAYDTIVGDIVITGGIGSEGETLGLTEEVAHELADDLSKKVS